MTKLFSILLLTLLFVAGPAVKAQSNTASSGGLISQLTTLLTGHRKHSSVKATLPDNLASKIQDNYFIYDDYRFDISQILDEEHLEDVLMQLKWQVYFINVLNLPQEIRDFFKSIPTVVAPATKETDPEKSGDYDETTSKSITLRVDLLIQEQSDWRSTRWEDPVFLYLLLTALLDQHLPQGVNNPDIVKYFEQAKSLPYYQERKPTWFSYSTLSDNIKYFFTDSAFTYLRGSYWNEPCSCYVIQKNQPEFFHYLENLFGPNSGFLNQCFSYHGFNFNYSQMDDFSHYQDVCNECIRQVQYIESAELPQNIIDFFKTVPLSLKAQNYFTDTYVGEYRSFTESIKLKADYFSSIQETKNKDSVLLHELLHAFHDQVLLKGDDNPYISQFFQDAMQHRYYYDTQDRDAYFNYWTTNQREFFACTAMAFLDDFAPYEPFTRANISKYQPNYYLYLQTIFGTRHDDKQVIEWSSLSSTFDQLY